MEIIELINDYIACSSYMCSSLKHYYNITNHTLLLARKSYNLIPKEGFLPDGIYFNFHGGGCYFEFENGEIDVDFGPNDRCDGFDFYRLKNYLKFTKSAVYRELNDNKTFSIQFEYIIRKGIIFKPGWSPNRDLYYLVEVK